MKEKDMIIEDSGVNIWEIKFGERVDGKIESGLTKYVRGNNVIEVAENIPNHNWNMDYAFCTSIRIVGLTGANEEIA